ncbi:MAG: inositol monophosphatase [Gammaproteobacteria bacterium]|nr:inositol monophosphatase [Gammaproteobacteria bacterium]
MHPLLNIAIRAARNAGNIITRNLDRVDTVTITKKGFNDFVTEIDRQAEHAIIDAIHHVYPDHAILAEESGVQGKNDHVWIIDPLDGTTNYLHGFPVFSVSIALKIRDRLECGVVYDPLRQELFTATRGQGAQLNDRRIRVSQCKSLKDALVGTGFPFREFDNLDPYLAIFRELITKTAGIRRAGSAAIDLAYVACGRLDAFWEFDLREWDIAAGALLIQESGGFVSDLKGGNDYLKEGDIVTGGEKMFNALSTILHSHLPPG